MTSGSCCAHRRREADAHRDSRGTWPDDRRCDGRDAALQLRVDRHRVNSIDRGLAARPAIIEDADPRVLRAATTTLPTAYGRFTAHGYRDLRTGAEHLALVSGDPGSAGAVVRLHSECLTGDVLGSLRCDCGPQLQTSLATVANCGGVVLYLRGHEGRGVGLLSKLEAYVLQDGGRDTVDANLDLGLPADAREYGAAAAILADLGLRQVRLLTNNPAKVQGLAAHGVEVVDRLPLVVGATEYSAAYLETKRKRMGHDLPPTGEALRAVRRKR